jgi:hypothetical protein
MLTIPAWLHPVNHQTFVLQVCDKGDVIHHPVLHHSAVRHGKEGDAHLFEFGLSPHLPCRHEAGKEREWIGRQKKEASCFFDLRATVLRHDPYVPEIGILDEMGAKGVRMGHHGESHFADRLQDFDHALGMIIVAVGQKQASMTEG